MRLKARWYLYILRCADGSLYTGVATDVERRLKEHALGKGSRYVYSKLPAKVVYQESRPNRSSVLKREAQIKRLTRRQKQALVAGENSS